MEPNDLAALLKGMRRLRILFVASVIAGFGSGFFLGVSFALLALR